MNFVLTSFEMAISSIRGKKSFGVQFVKVSMLQSSSLSTSFTTL
jgi:hypothetical protein